jgi:sigma-E factor negative regulatory protein RseC
LLIGKDNLGGVLFMKTEEGIVVETSGNIAKIKAGRHNDCKNCGACAGTNSIIVCARNTEGAIPGQRVEFELKESNAVLAAFVVFMFPLIGVFMGVLLGSFIGSIVGNNPFVFELLGGILMFIVTIICIKYFNHYINNNEKAQPAILKIL